MDEATLPTNGPAEAGMQQPAPGGAAPEAQGAPETPGSMIWLIMILWVVVIYFFFIRPQKKKDRNRRDMISQVGKGDRIVTVGGIHGTVVALGAETMTIRVDDKTGTTMKIARAAVNAVPSQEEKDKAAETKDNG